MTQCSIRSSVVPIMYVAGSGGHFLSALLRRARSNFNNTDYGISGYGNCHDAKIDFGVFGGMESPYQDKIDRLKQKILEPNVTYYWPIHFDDIDHLMKEFDRSIKITYEERDYSELAAIFYVKWGVEGNNTKLPFSAYKFEDILIQYQKSFYPTTDYGDSILNISWYELYHERDIDLIIDKLSNFTGIPVDRFDENFIVYWRESTAKGLLAVDELNKGNQYS